MAPTRFDLFAPLRPDYTAARVTELVPEQLAAWGIASLLLDVDCTLKSYRSTAPLPDVMEWLETMQLAEIGLCLVSNGRPARVAAFAEPLRLPFVALARKPLPRGCHEAIRKTGFTREATALVGDQLFTDVLAAHWSGIKSILVKPIAPHEEPWFARIKRPLERWVGRTS